MPKPEYTLCKAVAEYLRMQYPKVEFHFDLAGLNLSRAQAGMMKGIQGRRGFPDLQIMEPRSIYHGAFFELKAEGVRTKKKDGTGATEHIEEQLTYIDILNQKRYYTAMTTGLDETLEHIDYYLSL